ncbi:hypothetical protein TTHERM_000313349 (macronuclear) [Tetrahymena thermophila SB210]|uniref:Uncharacterized protein n=1 Tax=Tetrahymena thermophila (strain SB210) TaxID=312017 RepID=W7X793_TETTS|nr:hypothetical protein TTHERM_000313349 [Tetrahymena thermophila SB210]EWS72258.1 hypothetical protein TTHERM_000313349 [Tetrahymena thermophila SB210]|eukprot:XP_012655198.1 hypothetical protein TTHERM_000313349 [Tetrahymena thermophila SB210]
MIECQITIKKYFFKIFCEELKFYQKFIHQFTKFNFINKNILDQCKAFYKLRQKDRYWLIFFNQNSKSLRFIQSRYFTILPYIIQIIKEIDNTKHFLTYYLKIKLGKNIYLNKINKQT